MNRLSETFKKGNKLRESVLVWLALVCKLQNSYLRISKTWIDSNGYVGTRAIDNLARGQFLADFKEHFYWAFLAHYLYEPTVTIKVVPCGSLLVHKLNICSLSERQSLLYKYHWKCVENEMYKYYYAFLKYSNDYELNKIYSDIRLKLTHFKSKLVL